MLVIRPDCTLYSYNWVTMSEADYHNDPGRDISDASIGLTCRIYGQAPVQAAGRVNRHPFYFRARHAAWEFTVSVSHDIDAAAIWPRDDKQGFFVMDEYRGYFLCGDYRDGEEASFMRYSKVEEIIRACIQRFLNEDTGLL